MIGRLTFDKSSQDVDLLLYSVYLIDEFGKDGIIRRNFDRNSFVERMADYIHTAPYDDKGLEIRTVFNKSLYAQYYGFIDRFDDSDGDEWLRLTSRGRRLLPYITLERSDNGYQCIIKDEDRQNVQDLVWESVLFDPHGKHNFGAQSSRTDVDPLGVIFQTIMTLGYASNDEIFYAIYGLNRGDSGDSHFEKTYPELLQDIRRNRETNELDYKSLFAEWKVTNKVNDAKLVNIFSDPEFCILIKRIGENGIEYNYIDNSCHRFFTNTRLVNSCSLPKQYILYSNNHNSCIKWVRESLMGRFGDAVSHHLILENGVPSEEVNLGLRRYLTLAQANPENDYYVSVVSESEAALKVALARFIQSFERVNDPPSRQHGYSKSVLDTTTSDQIILTPNLHIIPIIITNSPVMTESVFDGTFRRLKIDEKEEDIIIPSNIPFDEAKFKEYLTLLLKNGNLILTGAPGTGKTFLAKAMAASIVGQCSWEDLSPEQKERCGFVQFHPSYDYTDFVEGLRPTENGSFELRDGVFKDFCKKALDAEGEECVFIIDEINRGELSKIFGELFYSIEPDYRGRDGLVMTQYNKMIKPGDAFQNGFYIPENVYIIGTMNDVDRGVEAMDFAVRRRFVWREITAEESAESMGITGDALAKMKAVNKALSVAGLSDAFHIGGAYFRKIENGDFNALWNLRLKGIVSEYFRGEPEAKEKIRTIENAFFSAKDESESDIL